MFTSAFIAVYQYFTLTFQPKKSILYIEITRKNASGNSHIQIAVCKRLYSFSFKVLRIEKQQLKTALLKTEENLFVQW